MREIVTIQVGDFANFIGSHFWNFQDELLGLAEDSQADVVFRNQCLNMDLLYRTGETQQGILTYTPRLVSIGFQGSLGSMSSRGTLYNEKQPAPSDVVTWSGNLSSQVSEPQKKNLFLQSLYKEEEKFHMMNGNTSVRHDIHSDISDKDIVECLENEVQYWTDFSKVHYHPRSLYELSGLWVDVQQFNNFGIGRDAFSDSLRGEEMNESLRFFIEECDHIQGIQFVVDDSGGFSGVAAEFLENIADEYTNTPVLLYSVRDPGQINPSSQRRTVCQNLHDAISFSRLSSFCKLIVPVGLPSLCKSKVGRFLCIDNGKPYHTSAVYASAIHSISLPFRMEPLGPTDESLYVSGAVDMNGAIQMLGGQARQNIVTILDVAMPAPPLTGTQAEQSVLENLHPLTPETSEDVEDLQAVESLTIHGAHGSDVQKTSKNVLLVPDVNGNMYPGSSVTSSTSKVYHTKACKLVQHVAEFGYATVLLAWFGFITGIFVLQVRVSALFLWLMYQHRCLLALKKKKKN
ncbi:uncharacterized protein LOC127803552 isoform X2 [Diospyros lotus]|uniref:uncharacterized protein LOC127803552 isoform X2 n=1 Tax=Diospyros lotus TaxID=55363 RepID=UPI00224E48C3|nr:uncharacterized protein LOC127803552 isoform X2 [Diospyros lotus]